MAAKSIKAERKEAIEQSIKKWTKISKAMYNRPENPCGLCDYIKNHPRSKCPLKDERCIKAHCISDWYNASNAADSLLGKLRALRKVN